MFSKRSRNRLASREGTKLHFMHSSCMVIIFFNTDLRKSAFTIYSFKKLVFRLFVFCFLSILFRIRCCLFYFELYIIFADFLINICAIIIYIGTKCSVILSPLWINFEDIEIFKYWHSNITLSQNDQNLGPLAPCLHLFDFGTFPFRERTKLYINPHPSRAKAVNRVIL